MSMFRKHQRNLRAVWGLTRTLHYTFSEHPTLPLRPAVADLMQLDEQFAQPPGATRALGHVWPATLLKLT